MSLCFDITQFARMPMASGIQRVLLQIADRCDDDDRFGVLIADELHVIAPAAAEMLIRSRFESSWQGPLWWDASDVALGRLTLDEVGEEFDGYVFAELTYQPDILDFWSRLAAERPDKVGAIFYDATPETHRELFGVQPPGGAGRYFRFVSSLDRVACISHGARRELAHIARRGEDEFVVAALGGDHLPIDAPSGARRSVVVLGDLKAKKRIDVVIEAFQRIRDDVDADLVIIGRSVHGEERMTRIVEEASRDSRVTWVASATDADLSRCLADAAAGAFVSSEEGFGLPVLELLNAGIPTVVDSTVPALDYLETDGQIRLDDVDALTVADALRRLLDTDADAFRAAAAALEVPSWDTFLSTIRELMARPVSLTEPSR